MSEVTRTRTRRVGHKGAHNIVPGNTLASFDAALEQRVDMIEFDILPADYTQPESSPLLLAHDPGAVRKGGCPTLDEGLAHLASAPFDGIEFDVDLKYIGYEARVVDALREHGLIDRCLVSSQIRESLAAVRELEPALKLGWSVPRATKDHTKSTWLKLPALGLLIAYRTALPRRAAAAIKAGHVDAIMSYYRLCTPALVRAVHAVGGQVYVWTVDTAPEIARYEAMGVDGVISNDPRLFS